MREKKSRIESKSVKWNMFMNAILTMSSFIFPLITFPYISRILLPVGTGKVNFATSVITYFSMFAQMGIPTYGIRACAKARDNKEELSRTAQELVIINLFMCLMVYVAFFGALCTVPRLRRDRTLFLIMSLSIALNALGMEWLYKALEEYTYITVRSVLFKGLAVVAMFMFVHEQADYVIYGGITIFAASASNILNFLNLRKHIYMRLMGGYQFGRHIRLILVFFSMSVATTVYTNLDNVMLGFMKSDIDVGYYGAAVKIKQILVSLITSASAVLLPRASYYVDRGKMEDFYNILKSTMHFIILSSVPICIYFVLYAREGILFLSGEAFEGAVIPMQIIMPTLILIGITNVLGIQMMVPLGREKKVLYSEIAGAVADLILNCVFIPAFASAGAALGTLAAELIVLLWQLVSIRDIQVNIFSEVSFGKIIIASVIGSLSCIWVRNAVDSSFAVLLLSAMCFFGSYSIVLIILKEQFFTGIIMQIFRRVIKQREENNL